MLLAGKALTAIEDADLQNLIALQMAEAKTLEYKAELPGGTASERKEFLADVSSFANASGGHLIFGMKTANGLPSEVCGLVVQDVDREILRLEDMIRNGIRPRIAFSVQPVPLQNQHVAILMQIPRGMVPPHQIVFDKEFRFYARNSAGKYRLDVDELRVAFDLLGMTAERIRNFRADRLAQILAGETPVLLSDAPKIVLHIVPIGAFNPAIRFDVTTFTEGNELQRLRPTTVMSGDIYHWYNFDGFLRYEKGPLSSSAAAYVQLFHNGIIEAVDADIVQKPWSDHRGSPYIPAESYERALLEALPRYLSAQEKLGVEPPVLIMLSLLGVKGYFVALRDTSGHRTAPSTIDRDTLLVPEAQLDNLHCDPAEALRPLFDAVANAGGWPRALTYDAAGKWTGVVNPRT